VIISGSVKALCIDNSTSVLICADTIIDHVYIVNSSKIQLIIGGKIPRVVIEHCIGVELLTDIQDDEHEIETEKSSGVILSMVALPDAPLGRAAPTPRMVHPLTSRRRPARAARPPLPARCRRRRRPNERL
jgi:hypothetical protein